MREHALPCEREQWQLWLQRGRWLLQRIELHHQLLQPATDEAHVGHDAQALNQTLVLKS